MSNKELVSIIKANKWVRFDTIYYDIFEDDPYKNSHRHDSKTNC